MERISRIAASRAGNASGGCKRCRDFRRQGSYWTHPGAFRRRSRGGGGATRLRRGPDQSRRRFAGTDPHHQLPLGTPSQSARLSIR